jgi:hypothetical protein
MRDKDSTLEISIKEIKEVDIEMVKRAAKIYSTQA